MVVVESPEVRAAPHAGAAAPAPPPAPAPAAAGPFVGSLGWALLGAARLFAGPPNGVMPSLAALVAEVLPGAGPPALAVLTGDCSRAPLKIEGGARLGDAVTSGELARLTARVAIDEPWVGTARIGGEERRVLAIATAPAASAGSLFVLALGDLDPDAPTIASLHGLCAVAAAAFADRAAEAPPGPIPDSLVAAQERARAIVELTEQHETALTSILSALRARSVDDHSARLAARDVAVKALIELRESERVDRTLAEEQADAAFDRLREQLAPIGNYADTDLELVAPGSVRPIPSELAHALRATTRGLVLVQLEQEDVGRLRVAWAVRPDAIEVAVRDDGPGTLATAALEAHRTLERVEILGGTVVVDAAAGWGTTVVATLPLAPVERGPVSPLAALNPRELEVLGHVMLGRRNADIAAALQLSTHTVKFHLAGVLRKLEVGTRGEAAAVAREHGLRRPS